MAGPVSSTSPAAASVPAGSAMLVLDDKRIGKVDEKPAPEDE